VRYRARGIKSNSYQGVTVFELTWVFEASGKRWFDQETNLPQKDVYYPRSKMILNTLRILINLFIFSILVTKMIWSEFRLFWKCESNHANKPVITIPTKKTINTELFIYGTLDNRGPVLPGNFFKGTHPNILHYTMFFSRDLLMFWSLENPRVRGLGWRGHTCIKNLPWVGVEVCTKFGLAVCVLKRDIGRYIGTNSLFYIFRWALLEDREQYKKGSNARHQRNGALVAVSKDWSIVADKCGIHEWE